MLWHISGQGCVVNGYLINRYLYSSVSKVLIGIVTGDKRILSIIQFLLE